VWLAYQFIKKIFYGDTKPAPEESKELIFKKLRKKSWSAKDIKVGKRARGD